MQIDKRIFAGVSVRPFIITVFLLSFSLSGISDRLWLLATVFLLSLTSLFILLVVFFLRLISGVGAGEVEFCSLLYLHVKKELTMLWKFYLYSSSSVTWTTIISSVSFLRFSDDMLLKSFVVTSFKAASDLSQSEKYVKILMLLGKL